MYFLYLYSSILLILSIFISNSLGYFGNELIVFCIMWVGFLAVEMATVFHLRRVVNLGSLKNDVKGRPLRRLLVNFWGYDYLVLSFAFEKGKKRILLTDAKLIYIKIAAFTAILYYLVCIFTFLGTDFAWGNIFSIILLSFVLRPLNIGLGVKFNRVVYSIYERIL